MAGRTITSLLVAIVCTTIFAGPLPEGGTPLIAEPLKKLQGAGAKVVDAEHPGFKKALRIQSKVNKNFWSAFAGASIPTAVKKGDVIGVRFFARAIKSNDETGDGILVTFIQEDGNGWTKSLSREETVPGKWREYCFRCKSLGDYPADGMSANFGIGKRKQIIEIGGIEFRNYGKTIKFSAIKESKPIGYAGREPNAPWRAEAKQRIEKIRKNDFKVTVVDAAGKPVSGADVKVEMTRHSFPFGTAARAWRLVKNDDPANKMYRKKLIELFNAGTLGNGLKWMAWRGDWNTEKYGRGIAKKALEWFKDNGMAFRGHVLIWPSYRHMPKHLKDVKDAAQLRAAIEEHIADEVSSTKGLAPEWDVINEPRVNHDVMDVCGDEIMVEWFKQVRAILPDSQLYFNDYSILVGKGVAHMEKTAKFLIKNKAPIDGIGIQGHFGNNPPPPVKMKAILDRLAKLGLKMRITEFDVNCSDEDLQADFLRDLLTLTFSHPNIVGFQLWGFWEGEHWRPQAAMFRKDWSERKSAAVWKQLIFKDWWTNVAGKSDAKGQFVDRGFFGKHKVSVTVGNKTKTATFEIKAGTASIVKVVLD